MLALETFGSLQGAESWLATPALGLRGKTPISMLRTAKGRAAVKLLLQRIDYGVLG